MNDCVWALILCECEKYRCDKYISANCPVGELMLEIYEEEVEQSLKPVKEKYKKMFNGKIFNEKENDNE